MKKRRSYQEEVEKLCQAIDISIEAYRTYPPKDWTPDIVNRVTTNLEKDKQRILEVEPKFKTLASLKYDIEAVFTYFREGAGKTVEYFWKKLGEEGLDYTRENILDKILKRGKIKGRIENEYITDMLVVAHQVGLTSEEETKRLSEMPGNFESKKK